MPRPHVRGSALQSTLLILVAAIAAGLGLWAAGAYFEATPRPAPPALRAVDLFPATRPLPAFRLLSGPTPITPASLKGHWTLAYIGFTHCPDVCPTTLQMLGVAARSWGDMPPARRPQVLFVSVDPQRDSPAHVREYAHYFGKDIVGATADPATIDRFVRGLGLVYFIGKHAPGGNYEVDHSAAVAVLDPDGAMAGLIRPAPPPAQPFDPGAIGADLKALTQWR